MKKNLVNPDDSTLLCLTRSHITDWKGVDFLRLFETAEQLMYRREGSVRLQLIHQVLRKPTATAFLGWRWVKHEMWHLPRCWVLTESRSAGQVYLTLKVSCDALQRWKVLISCYVSLQAFFFFSTRAIWSSVFFNYSFYFSVFGIFNANINYMHADLPSIAFQNVKKIWFIIKKRHKQQICSCDSFLGLNFFI